MILKKSKKSTSLLHIMVCGNKRHEGEQFKRLLIKCTIILQDKHLNIPFGHGFGTEVPTGQKKPGGHRNPLRLSSGEGSEAPPTQTNPAAQGPLGKVLPLNK